MSKEIVSTTDAPSAIGPYSQAIKAGGMVYVSGCIGLDPATMKLVEGGIEPETMRVLQNLQAIVEAAGSSLEKVVKCTVLLRDMADFPKVNAIYAQFFTDSRPARACFAVAGLPMNVQIEIDCIAME